MKNTPQSALPEGLQTAAGLVWGLLDQHQPMQALTLLKGCQSCWPDEPLLGLLHQVCLADAGRAIQMDALKNIPPPWHAMLDILKTRHQLNTANAL
jgi:hypothetical protein